MASPRMLMITMMVVIMSSSAMAQLDVAFYSKTCPAVEKIVREEMIRILTAAPTLAGPFLRLHFHDCFVRGCDGSVLIDTTVSSAPAEKDASPNQSLRGFGSVQRIKAKLDAACGAGIVSCADVLALMARDAVVLSKGPYWAVPLGRRDGRVSIANETKQLPPPTANITQLTQMFAVKGLDSKDLVVLSGGHTLGTAHCSAFSDRLYNFTGVVNNADVDPALDRSYLSRLRSRCASLSDNTTLAEMDPGSFLSFDASYYRLVAKRRGLFHSDSSLLADAFTAGYVRRQATGLYTAEFFKDFAESMVKMGGVGVLTGNQGEIRNKCYMIN